MAQAYGIHWFRRDLRVAGNPALQWNWKEHRGRVLGIFFVDPALLQQASFSVNRFAFLLAALRSLQNELRAQGGALLVLHFDPCDGFDCLVDVLKTRGIALPHTVSWNRDYSPFARARDENVTEQLQNQYGIRVHVKRDHLLLEPHEILKANGSPYSVYSPFAKRWFSSLNEPEIRLRIQSQNKAISYLEERAKAKPVAQLFELNWCDLFNEDTPLRDQLDEMQGKYVSQLKIALPPASSAAAWQAVQTFKNKIGDYAQRRDFPAEPATSQLSIYFKFGLISPLQVVAALGLANSSFKKEDGPTRFLKEIAWREFYYSILFHWPRVACQPFVEKYKDLAWENNKTWFAAWQEGRTGFPIVDAGMRQLRSTGWMHNRVRMIVASFLTKDLLIDWRWGERHFMQHLLDGDLAANNGGWQWAASTGCDPQPYFRIFNPYLQSKKFDPQGDYIRTWVPELASLSNKEIHKPDLKAAKLDYPAPIVDHAEQRDKALRLYKFRY